VWRDPRRGAQSIESHRAKEVNGLQTPSEWQRCTFRGNVLKGPGDDQPWPIDYQEPRWDCWIAAWDWDQYLGDWIEVSYYQWALNDP